MTIGLISPASAAKDTAQIDAGIAALRGMGYRVKEGRATRSKLGYLAATDAARLADLNGMLRDPKVDAIMCIRGGYGVMRILHAIDYAQAKRKPKIIIGFSDITALHLAFWKKCAMVTFNGPMALSAFAKNPPRPFTVNGFTRTLGTAKPAGSVWQGLSGRDYSVVRPGAASGRLVGGNLSLVASTIGTPYEIDTRGKLVFLEEVDEKPYRIDRMLMQLLLAGKLRNATGIIFGRNVPDDESAKLELERLRAGKPKKCPAMPRKAPREFEPIADDVIADLLAPLGIPVMIGAPFGHIDEYATIPIGVKASMDTRTGEFSIDEAAVR